MLMLLYRLIDEYENDFELFCYLNPSEHLWELTCNKVTQHLPKPFSVGSSIQTTFIGCPDFLILVMICVCYLRVLGFFVMYD